MHAIKNAMSTYQIAPQRIAYLIRQGIEVEKIKLEVYRSTKGDSIESHITILEGGRFLALIDRQESESSH